MKILIACEFSGIVRDAFSKKGHDAISCDILTTDSEGKHYKGDVFDIIDDGFDMMIAHPPCTYLSNSGVCHLHTDESRWKKLDEGADFFKKILESNIPKICVENPIMHKYARDRIGGVKYSQIVHPWMFGHLEQKSTCLWLKGLEKLIETNNVREEMMKLPYNERNRMHYLPPSNDRAKLRSKTYLGIAGAMAGQWG